MSDPVSQEQVDLVTRFNELLQQLASSGGITTQAFQQLQGVLSGYGQQLERNSAFTEKQTDQLGALAAIAVKTREHYSNLAYGINFSGMTDQLNEVFQAGDKGIQALSKLTGVTQSSGESIEQFKNRLAATAKEYAAKADNILRLEQGYISLASATGDLGKVMDATGGNFEELSRLAMVQGNLMAETTKATGLGAKQVEQYYSEFGKIPGVLTETVSSATEANERVSAFTAAIQVAHGTGRTMTEIQNDLNKAFSAYGLKGDSALNFSVKLAEVQRNNGVTMEVLKNALYSTADSFKGFADTGASANKMAEGAANIFNNYIDGLKKTGASAEQATGMIGNMTSQIKQMGLAQKAFLSAQTGGPGGLMGAFQIEKMLKEGDIEGVFKKVRDQMQKQLGPIVTLDEAAASPAAAAQLARQTAMLRAGPLGAMAQSDQDAYRILESMKTGAPPPKALGDTVQKAIGRGQEMESRRSLTAVKDIRDLLVQADLEGGMASLKFMQGGGAGGIGFGGLVSASQAARMDEMKGRQRAAAIRSGSMIERQQEAFDKGSVKELAGINAESMAASGKDVKDAVLKLPEHVFGPMKDQLVQLISSDSAEEDIRKKVLEVTTKGQEEVLKLRKQGEAKEASELSASLNEVSRQMELTKIPKAMRQIMELDTVEAAQENILQSALPTSAKINKATKQAITADQAAKSPQAAAAYERQKAGKSTEENEIHLKVTAICDGCKNPLETQHIRATSPGATVSITG